MTTDLTAATAADLSALYAAGAASPVEVLTAVLDRAARINPRLNALTMIDADGALAAARASEARWTAGAALSPIDGVPVSIKELVRAAGWPLTMGSRLTDKTPAKEDTPVVARLREAGAVLFAQSASPEYGYKGVTDSPLNGITRNPWNPDVTPGGSSGGAGAAVAAGLGPLGIGTDGGGSVRIPASFCGLVGLKATYGRIPAWPASMHGDLANTGPMTRTALDNALMMNVIARPDARDPFALPADDANYVQALKTDLKGKRVGFFLRYSDHPQAADVAEAVTAAARQFEALGAIVEVTEPPFDNTEAGMIWSLHWLSALQRLLQVYPEDRHGEFDPGLLEQARVGAGFSLQMVIDAQVRRRELCHAWNLFFTRFDLLITPTLNVDPWAVGQNLPLREDGAPNYSWANTAVFNLTRHPAVTTPCGLSRAGLPIGLQIVGPMYHDAQVLAAAAAYAEAAPLVIPDLPR